jgi:hypothetical protein
LETVNVTHTSVKVDLAFLDLVEYFVLSYQRSTSSPGFSGGFGVGGGDDTDPYIGLDRVRKP